MASKEQRRFCAFYTACSPLTWALLLQKSRLWGPLPPRASFWLRYPQRICPASSPVALANALRAAACQTLGACARAGRLAHIKLTVASADHGKTRLFSRKPKSSSSSPRRPPPLNPYAGLSTSAIRTQAFLQVPSVCVKRKNCFPYTCGPFFFACMHCVIVQQRGYLCCGTSLARTRCFPVICDPFLPWDLQRHCSWSFLRARYRSGTWCITGCGRVSYRLPFHNLACPLRSRRAFAKGSRFSPLG